MKLPNAKTLPEVITFRQVHQLIDATTTLRMETYFWTVYSLGLRMQEGLNLEVSDIDGERGLVHVHRGKGAKDRYIPLPSSTLDMLRRYWVTHRHKRFLFPADGRNHNGMSTATTTMSPTALQGAMKKITRQLNCGKDQSTRWLEKQSPRLLPVHHFLVTFTVPDQVGSLLRRRQREGYSALFDAGAGSIRDVGAATKSLRGCNLGFFGVLHTWGRDPMVYFVQHALPRGQQKIRYYGWMGSNFRVRLDEVKWLLEYLDSG